MERDLSNELIDSNIFLNVYFNQRDKTKCLDILNKSGKTYNGFISTIQVSHILRRINQEILKLENSKSRDLYKKNELISKFRMDRQSFCEKIESFTILDFSEKDKSFLDELERHELRMEFHDKINIAIAIRNKLNIQAIDADIMDDFSTIEEISKQFGHKIKLNKDI